MTRFALNKNFGRLALAVLLASTASFSFGAMALIDPSLSGNKQIDVWENATLSANSNPGFPAFPGTGAWPNPIASATSNVGIDGDAVLAKVANGASGGPYPASGSIYFGGFSETPNTLGGTLGVRDTTPVAGVSNIVLQLQLGEAFGYDLYNNELPVLNYNGGSQALVATNAIQIGQEFVGTFPDPLGGPDLPLYTNTYLFQWDATDLGITSLSINFRGAQHSLVYQLRLDQSDVFQAVPEPSSLVLAGLAMLGVVGLGWRKRRSR